MREILRLFLCGDVMTGRGIDQALPHPNGPRLHERSVKDARRYIDFAETKHGPIMKPLYFRQIWGVALAELDRFAPDARIVNLETSITQNADHWRGKAVHYRMHPANSACLTAAGLDCCALANNHVLDWGYDGLRETLSALHDAGIPYAGAGHDLAEAAAPAKLATAHDSHIIVAAAGSVSSGIPRQWQALRDKPGVYLLTDAPEKDAYRLISTIRPRKQQRDIALVSIHWGGNWGYEVSSAQRELAHRLIDSGVVDIVHGHSAHHVKGIEVYRGKLILYGCGDFLTDYEGIGGHEAYRSDLSLMYLPEVEPESGLLTALTLIPTTMQRFQVRYASAPDVYWLAGLLNRESIGFGVDIQQRDDGVMVLVSHQG